VLGIVNMFSSSDGAAVDSGMAMGKECARLATV
jgi:hypothetical protein